MQRRHFLAGTTLLVAPALAGCTGDGADGGGTTPAGDDGEGGSAATVELRNTAFDPVKTAVDVGDTVEWRNKDSFEHDVTSAQFSDEAAEWDFVEPLGAEDSVTHTFEAAGRYEFYCSIHGEESMCGVVLVGGATAGDLPCEDDGGGYYGIGRR